MSSIKKLLNTNVLGEELLESIINRLSMFRIVKSCDFREIALSDKKSADLSFLFNCDLNENEILKSFYGIYDIVQIKFYIFNFNFFTTSSMIGKSIYNRMLYFLSFFSSIEMRTIAFDNKKENPHYQKLEHLYQWNEKYKFQMERLIKQPSFGSFDKDDIDKFINLTNSDPTFLLLFFINTSMEVHKKVENIKYKDVMKRTVVDYKKLEKLLGKIK